MNSGFYRVVGNVGDVDSVKHKCRLSLQAILKKHTGVLSAKEFKGFNLGNSIEDYTLPSLRMNLLPKYRNSKKRLVQKMKIC